MAAAAPGADVSEVARPGTSAVATDNRGGAGREGTPDTIPRENLTGIPGLDARSAPSSFDSDPSAKEQRIQREDEPLMASLGSNLLSMIGGRSPPSKSQSLSFASQSSPGASGGNVRKGDLDRSRAERGASSSVSPSQSNVGGGMSSMFSGISTGWSNWSGSRNKSSSTLSRSGGGGRLRQRQDDAAQRKVTKDISWGILGEVQMQVLIRNDICGRHEEKIHKMYQWLGHVVDGQPLALLPSKGLELKGIRMRTCGLFLDCVIPFLNDRCHPDCRIEARWLLAARGGNASPRVQEWRRAKKWVVKAPDGVSAGRARSWTVETLLGSRAAEEGGYVDWRSRFGLEPSQELGSVHIRLHMVSVRR